MALRSVEVPQGVRGQQQQLEGAGARAYELLSETWRALRLLINAYDTRYPAKPDIPDNVIANWPDGKLRLEEDGVALELYKTPGAGLRRLFTIKVTGVPLPPPIAGIIPWSGEESRHLVVEGEEGFTISEAVALAHLMAHPKIGEKVKKLVERLSDELAKQLSPEDKREWGEFFALAGAIANSLERSVRDGTLPAELLEQWFLQITHPFVLNVDESTTVFVFLADVPAIAVRKKMPDGRYGYWLIADFAKLSGHEDSRLAAAAKLGVKIIEGEEVLETVARHAPTLAEHLREYVTGLATEEVLPVLEWLADFSGRLKDALSPAVLAAAKAKG